MTLEEITEKFTYHKATPNGTISHHKLSAAFIQLAIAVDEICPDGREKALAITNLQQAKMWASAAVAINPKTR